MKHFQPEDARSNSSPGTLRGGLLIRPNRLVQGEIKPEETANGNRIRSHSGQGQLAWLKFLPELVLTSQAEGLMPAMKRT
jgi:hypothetical protein